MKFEQIKENVNSHYGMCVTRLVNEEIKYINDEWTTYLKSDFLITRYNLLQFFDKNKIGRDIVYIDTDSIYIRNYEKHKHIIKKIYEKEF